MFLVSTEKYKNLAISLLSMSNEKKKELCSGSLKQIFHMQWKKISIVSNFPESLITTVQQPLSKEKQDWPCAEVCLETQHKPISLTAWLALIDQSEWIPWLPPPPIVGN